MENKELLNNLIELKNKLGRSPKKADLCVTEGSKYSYNTYQKHFGSLNVALDLIGLKPNKLKNIANEDIIEDIKYVYNKLDRTPTYKEYNKEGNIGCDFQTIKRKFGSWNEALELAGIEIKTHINLGQENIIKELKKWYEKNNNDYSCLTTTNINKANKQGDFPITARAIQNNFPDVSWESLMRQVASDYIVKKGSPSKRKISNEDLIENMKDMYTKLGRVPQKEDLKLDNGSKYSQNAYKRAFGSIAASIIAADLKPHQVRGVSKEDFIKDLQNIYKKLGYTPTQEEYQKESIIGYGFTAIKTRFGSWNNALIEAGIPVVYLNKVDKFFIIDELKKWYIKNNCKSSCLSYFSILKAKKNREFPFGPNAIKSNFDGMPWEDIMKKIDPSYNIKSRFCNYNSYIGDDKNYYKSLLELDVANYLFSLKIKNKIKNYEYEYLVCDDKMWTCDFVIDLNDGRQGWLEVDGMRANRKQPYKNGNEKIKYYEDNNINYKIVSYNNRNIRKSIGLWLEVIKDHKIGNKIFNLDKKEDNFIFFTKENIYNYHKEHGETAVMLDLVIPFYEYLLQYIELYGWIYPETTETHLSVLNELNKNNNLNSSSKTGVSFIKSHFRSIWSASTAKNASPIKAIYNHRTMLGLLKYRFGISNSKLYKYNFNGNEIFFNELFDISLKQIRRAFEVNRYVVSVFKPEIAKYIYNKYGSEQMRVWDPCGGFGGRMLGFAGAFKLGTYIANEPNPETYIELQKLSNVLDIDVIIDDSPVEDISPPKVDLVFTCPPYDFVEHYCDDDRQSDIRYKTYDEWKDGFLTTLINKSALASDKLILIINQKNKDVCVEIAENIGFNVDEIMPISNRPTHITPRSNDEFCLVFSK